MSFQGTYCIDTGSDMDISPQIEIFAKEVICRVYQQKLGNIILGIKGAYPDKHIQLSLREFPECANMCIKVKIIFCSLISVSKFPFVNISVAVIHQL